MIYENVYLEKKKDKECPVNHIKRRRLRFDIKLADILNFLKEITMKRNTKTSEERSKEDQDLISNSLIFF